MKKQKTSIAFRMNYKTLKQVSDFILALMTITVLLWLFLLIFISVKLDSKGPILFQQRRIGKDKRFFIIYKFRTMRIDAPKDTPTHLLPDPNLYITTIGKFLRKTSIDEIPQLWNILKGDISFIGPRPALWNQYDLIEEREKYNVNSIKPGLTGWAQVNGRDELPIPLKAKLDGDYVSEIGLKIDLLCFLKSVYNVLYGKDIKEGREIKSS